MNIKPFLFDLAVYLKDNYDNNLSRICIILPNRRGALFLKRHLFEIYRKTIFLPQILSVEELLQQITGLKLIDNTDLLFESYETYCSINSEPESFADFSKWAPSLLNDFNEIDKSLANSNDLFAYLNDAKAIDLWSPSNIQGAYELTDFQKKYLNFWNSIGDFYFQLTKRLIEKECAYQGLAFRYVNEKFENIKHQIDFDKLIFAGFNAFNTAEEQFVKKLILTDKLTLVWDADEYYLKDENQEAGRFMRRYFKDGLFQKASHLDSERSVSFTKNNLLTDSKTIKVTGVSGNIAQVKFTGKLLEDFTTEQLQKTAIILADENLLLPVLHSLPSNIQSINITMGYGFNNSVVADFVNKFLQLFISRDKYSNSDSFFYADIIQLLNHPLWKQSSDSESSRIIDEFVEQIINTNRVWISKKEITDYLSQTPFLLLLSDMFSAQQFGVRFLVERMIDLFRQIVQFALENDTKINEINREFIWTAIKVLKRILSLQNKYENIANADTLKSIFQMVARNASVSFVGEPLAGLQIMGMLETRTLDFENIILLSVNEDVLPKSNSGHSFIPFDIKREFKMLTTSDKDAVYAYHFYRLLQRGKNIHLLYNSETGNVGKNGEKSRFIVQLKNEILKNNPNIVFDEQMLNIPIQDNGLESAITIEKSPDISNRLLELFAKGLSPTSLNKYRACSLRFYFHHIARLRESEEVSETIDAAVFGTVLHKVLEIYYSQIIDRPVTIEFISESLQTIEKNFLSVLSNQKKKYDISFGKNLLSVKIAVKYIQRLLLFEKDKIDNEKQNITLKAVEKPLESMIKVNELAIKLIGNIDRIDSCNNLLRIIDYKTGSVNDKELNLNSVDDLKDKEKLNEKSFQLLMYAYLYHKENHIADFNSAVLSFRAMNKGLMNLKINKSIVLSAEVFQEFENYLTELLIELLDQKVPFTQTRQVKTCEYCDFKLICNR